MLTQINKIVTN